ncbi:glycosyltransferase family 4 protein [Enterococcus rotai]|uniref:glycosyltransferase family 4 protein n=1 Tax=Enterococcus rotai TaxID=118060 RepID=UPI0032B32207
MNILFLSLLDFDNLNQSNIYTDLLKKFIEHGHNVSIVSPTEKRNKKQTHIIELDSQSRILKVKIGNIQKTNILEKGVSTVLIEQQYIKAIKKYFSTLKFDLVVYATPPVTFEKVISFVKKRDGAFSYLLLKDIFPQNAVDLGKLSKNGLIYNFFRKKEVNLYKLSDRIGAMSKGNADYLLKHNTFLDSRKIEVNPNSIEIKKENKISLTPEETDELKEKLSIPLNKTLFLYGGNLGIPQGLDFFLDVLTNARSIDNIYFLIIGAGTQFHKIDTFIKKNELTNVQLLKTLPKEDYEKIEKIVDVGLVFLDHRFTIPNIPSRILGYMKEKKAILAATDIHTDLKDIITEGQLGLWCESGDLMTFLNHVETLNNQELRKNMGENGFNYLEHNYDVLSTYKKIVSHI